jgi:hypothetical protein
MVYQINQSEKIPQRVGGRTSTGTLEGTKLF